MSCDDYITISANILARVIAGERDWAKTYSICCCISSWSVKLRMVSKFVYFFSVFVVFSSYVFMIVTFPCSNSNQCFSFSFSFVRSECINTKTIKRRKQRTHIMIGVLFNVVTYARRFWRQCVLVFFLFTHCSLFFTPFRWRSLFLQHNFIGRLYKIMLCVILLLGIKCTFKRCSVCSTRRTYVRARATANGWLNEWVNGCRVVCTFACKNHDVERCLNAQSECFRRVVDHHATHTHLLMRKDIYLYAFSNNPLPNTCCTPLTVDMLK